MIYLSKIKKIKDVEAPRGEEAISPKISDQVVLEMNDEKLNEKVQGMMDKMMSGADFSPIIIGKQNGKFIISTMEQKSDGTFVMPDIKGISRIQKFWKERRVDRILRKIHPILRRDIGPVTKVALMRKSEDDLKELEKRLRKKSNRRNIRITNRVGCIFLEFDDLTIQI